MSVFVCLCVCVGGGGVLSKTLKDQPPYVFAYWVILHAFLSPADFFQNQKKDSFRNIYSVKQFGS